MTADLERRVVRKLQGRILPFVMLLYFVSFLDRVNVGFAAFDMNKTIGLTPAEFGLGGGLFFISYFLFEVPSNLILYRVGARCWIARVMISWGVVSMASAFITGPRSFYVLRFLLGAAEAGFFPGIILYLSLWFPSKQRAVAVAAFMAAAPLSTAIGSPLSGAIMQMRGFAGLHNWQWLYILEALPAILLGFVVLRVLIDSPDKAAWLENDEREWLLATLSAEQAEKAAYQDHAGSIWPALRDPRILALSVVYLGTSAGLYTLGLWAPLIFRQFGFSPLQTGYINAVPGIAAIVGMIVWARHSDRTLERNWHVILPCAVACLGFLWAGTAHAAIAAILALTLVNVGVNAAKAPLWAMPGTFLSGAGAAAGIALINSIGNLGGFMGPFVIGWIRGRSGSYDGGLFAVGAMLALSAVLMVVLRFRLEQRPQGTV